MAEWEAAEIALELQRIYGGRILNIIGAGLEEPPAKEPSPQELALISKLASESDIILTSASHWHAQHSLIVRGRHDPQKFPPVGSDVTGLMCGAFLAPNGEPIPKKDTHYRVRGLGYDGFLRAAKRRVVVLVAGGKNRRAVILAALKGKLISVLITTKETAEWLLEENRNA